MVEKNEIKMELKNEKSYVLQITALICITIISIFLIIALAWGNIGMKYAFIILGVLAFIFIFIILPEYLGI